MGGASLPPGFRFHPTDEELVGYYLKRKIEGQEIELEVIPDIDLYKFDPWELPEKSFLPSRDMEWFFFCSRDKKYPNGSRTNRATKAGYWKATGKDRKVICQSVVTGYRKTLVFYRGRAPLGDRTDWVMHEYRLCDDVSQCTPSFQGPYALCRVIKKNEKIGGSDQTESKTKQIGSSSSNENANEPVFIPDDQPLQSGYSSPMTTPYQATTMVDYELASMGYSTPTISTSPDVMLESSTGYSQGLGGLSENFPEYQFPTTMTSWQPHDRYEASPSSTFSNFREDVEPSDCLYQLGRMSPYSVDGNYFGLYENQDMQYKDYHPTDSSTHPNFF